MATTQLQVCNYSLALVGAEPITQVQLTAATEKRSLLCDTFYTVVLKDLLRDSIWNFATTTVELSAIAGDVAEGGWDYDYTLPTDYLQLLEIHYTDNGGPIPKVEWAITEDTLYCNHSEVSLKYTKYVSEPDSWSADFARLFRYALAVELSYPLSGSNEQFARLEAKYDKLLAASRFNNARENGKKQIFATNFTDARLG